MLQILANMKYYKQITFNHLKKINKNNQIGNERGTNKWWEWETSWWIL